MKTDLRLTDTNAASDSRGRTWGLEGSLFWWLVGGIGAAITAFFLLLVVLKMTLGVSLGIALVPLALCLAYIFGLRQGKPPGNDSDTNSPPDQLTLEYPAAVVTLEGWRLDLLAQELRFGHVVRIRVVPPPSTTSKVEEPHVTRIWARELGELVSDEAATPAVAQANN